MGLDLNDPRPAYQQVADDLRRGIKGGRFKPGDQLPSGRELARRYGIAPMTVRHALDILKSEGLVVSRQGRAVFVRDSSPTEEIETPDTTAYDAVMGQLQAIRADMRQIEDRLSRLEELVHPSTPEAPKRAR
jgi:GntR family transcriptional regulator